VPPHHRVVSLATVAIAALFAMAIVAWPMWSEQTKT